MAPVGRPKKEEGHTRTVSPMPKELEELGKELVKYVKDNVKTILHIKEWYSIEKDFTYCQWKTFIQRKEFIPYYEKALSLIGKKYLDKDSNVRDSIAHRWHRIYFRDYLEDEDANADRKMEREMQLKRDAEERRSIPPGDSIVTDLISNVKLSYANEQLSKEIEALRAQIESKPKANNIVQPSE